MVVQTKQWLSTTGEGERWWPSIGEREREREREREKENGFKTLPFHIQTMFVQLICESIVLQVMEYSAVFFCWLFGCWWQFYRWKIIKIDKSIKLHRRMWQTVLFIQVAACINQLVSISISSFLLKTAKKMVLLWHPWKRFNKEKKLASWCGRQINWPLTPPHIFFPWF